MFLLLSIIISFFLIRVVHLCLSNQIISIISLFSSSDLTFFKVVINVNKFLLKVKFSLSDLILSWSVWIKFKSLTHFLYNHIFTMVVFEENICLVDLGLFLESN